MARPDGDLLMELRNLTGPELLAALDDLAQLRISVFRDWPYLYDGDLDYERRYLATYAQSPGAIVVGAFDGARLVGAATGTPMLEHAEEFARPLANLAIPLAEIFYCAESVLLPHYRGRGLGHGFFDHREAHARSLGARYCAFCAVIRPENHPLRPRSARSNDSFWRKRGYRPLPDTFARFHWKDLGDAVETAKPLQFWLHELPSLPLTDPAQSRPIAKEPK
jgi:GNAT superfamily N-acetyltransferase